MTQRTTSFPTMMPGMDSATAAPALAQPLPGEVAHFAQAVHIPAPDQKIQPEQRTQSEQGVQRAQPQTEGPMTPSGKTGPAGTKAMPDSPNKPDRPDKTESPDSRGDAILHALGNVAPSPPPSPVGPAGQAASPDLAEISGMDQRVLTQLVDRILVSAQEGKQEVHIKVQDAVLKDTDIVVRMQDGQLHVQLHTSDSYSSQLLHQNVHTLRHALESRQFGETVKVQVMKTRKHDAGENSPQEQRSRGNFLWNSEDE